MHGAMQAWNHAALHAYCSSLLAALQRQQPPQQQQAPAGGLASSGAAQAPDQAVPPASVPQPLQRQLPALPRDVPSLFVMAAACAAVAEARLQPHGGLWLSAGGFPWPAYLINTRDCFSYHLVPVRTHVEVRDRTQRTAQQRSVHAPRATLGKHGTCCACVMCVL